MGYSGYCLCGSCTIVIRPTTEISHATCHCTDCQHTSGTTNTTSILPRQTDVMIVGDVHEYNSRAESGNIVTRLFCGTCGSSIGYRSTAFQGRIAIHTGNLPDFRISPALTPPQSSSHAKRPSLPNILLYSPISAISTLAESSRQAREREREKMAASTLTYEYLVDDRESSVDVWRRWEERQRKERGEPPRPSTPERPTLNDEEERRPGDAEQEGGTQGGKQGGEPGREQAADGANETDDVKGISMVELEQVNDQRETSLDVWRRYEEKRLREQQAKAVSGQEGEVNGATDGRRETTAPEGWCGSRKRKESPARDDESPSKAQKLHRQDSLERAAVAGAEELAQGIIA